MNGTAVSNVKAIRLIPRIEDKIHNICYEIGNKVSNNHISVWIYGVGLA